MDKYIREILNSSDRVIIPGFGAILVNKKDHSLFFNEYIKFNDGVLENLISKTESVSLGDATVKINAYAQSIKEAIKSENFEIAEVGAFSLQNGIVKFSPLNKVVEQEKVVEQQIQSVGVTEEENVHQESEKTVRESEKTDQQSQIITQDGEKVAQDAEPVAQESHIVTEDSQKIAQESEKVAQESEKVAQESEKIAQESELVTRDAEKVASVGDLAENSERDAIPDIKQESFTVQAQTIEGGAVVNTAEGGKDVTAPDISDDHSHKNEKKKEKKKEKTGEKGNRKSKESDDKKNLKKIKEAEKKQKKLEEKKLKKEQKLEKKNRKKTDDNAHEKPKKKRKRFIWLWLLILVIGGAVAWALVFPEQFEELKSKLPYINEISDSDQNQNENNTDQSPADSLVFTKLVNTSIAIGYVEPVLPDTMVVADTLQNIPEEIEVEQVEPVEQQKPVENNSGQGKKYHIILGCFEIKENADKFLNQLSQRGCEGQLFGMIGRLHAVYYKSFDSEAEAQAEIGRMPKDCGVSAWIFRK